LSDEGNQTKTGNCVSDEIEETSKLPVSTYLTNQKNNWRITVEMGKNRLYTRFLVFSIVL